MKPIIPAKRSAVWMLAALCLFQPAQTTGKQGASSGPPRELRGSAPSALNSARASLKADAATRSKIDEAYGRLPLSFEQNYGQADARARFLARGVGCNLFLSAAEAVLAFGRAHSSDLGLASKQKNGSMREATRCESQVCGIHSALRMKLKGASAAARPEALDRLPGLSNYFVGNDPKRWRAGVATYAKVKFRSVYPGIDVVYYGSNRQMEYDFNVAPGADFKAIRVIFEGAKSLKLDRSGDLLVETCAGELRQPKPVIYQTINGERRVIEGGYVIGGGREVAFEIGEYDRSRALVIDPVLIYSTSIGGSLNDTATDIAIDLSGFAYITGSTDSRDFPVVNPFQPRLAPPDPGIGVTKDAFVVKLNGNATAILYSTFLGGADDDTANAVAVDAAGNAYVTGSTRSADFPTTFGAFQTSIRSKGDAFITRLNASGNALVYSTYLGGVSSQIFFPAAATVGSDIAVDSSGNAYVTGTTTSPAFPVKRAAQARFNKGDLGTSCSITPVLLPVSPGARDAFVTKLNPTGTGLVYSTFLGGSGQDEGRGIALDSAGSAYVTGVTCSQDFPGASGYNGGPSDAFVAKLSPSGREVVYGAFIGGGESDAGHAVAVDSSGKAYITGRTASLNLQTSPGAFQAALGGSVAYVTDNGGTSWEAGAGLPNQQVNVLAVDPSNPSTVYAGTGSCLAGPGVFKSTDGGRSWKASGLANVLIETVAVDPKNSSTVYADRYKSTDGGATWSQMRITNLFGPVGEFIIDPVTPTTLYLVNDGFTCGDAVEIPTLFKSTDGGATWNRINISFTAFAPRSLAIDPVNTSTLYGISGGGLQKSTDGGQTWRVVFQNNLFTGLLAVDPVNPMTLYVKSFSSSAFSAFKVVKSIDGGGTFADTGLSATFINDLVIDPKHTATLYAATGIPGGIPPGGGGVFRSNDGGATWFLTDLRGMMVNTLAINPLDPSQLHAGALDDIDGFASVVSPAGAIATTYLGTRARDVGTSIVVDASNNLYITGNTFSDRFPIKDALESSKTSGPFATSAFLTKLRPGLDALDYSTYLEPDEVSSGAGVAVDAPGRVYVAGTRGTFRPVPLAADSDPAPRGIDFFVVKIASPPRITKVEIVGKHVVVTGEGFDAGAVVLIDNVEQKTRHNESQPTSVLTVRKAGKNIAPGQRAIIQVRNLDRSLSNVIIFVRPAG